MMEYIIDTSSVIQLDTKIAKFEKNGITTVRELKQIIRLARAKGDNTDHVVLHRFYTKVARSHYIKHMGLYEAIRMLGARFSDRYYASTNTLIYDTSNITKRGSAYLHQDNSNIVMNSSAMWYGSAKGGKTRILTKAFTGSNYIFLDFDANYDDVADLITKAGGVYLNGREAWRVLYQLMDKDIKDAVIIIDALNDVKSAMLEHYISTLSTKVDVEEIKNCERAMKHIGITQEATTTWYINTIKKMVNNSNSINVIHHTTENNGISKVEGNAGAWAAKFDITYELVKLDQGDNYFEKTHQRANIAPDTVGNTKTLDDMVKLLFSFLPEDKTKFTGSEYKKLQLNKKKYPKWFDYQQAVREIFIIKKDGRTTSYVIKPSFTAINKPITITIKKDTK